MEAKKLSWCFKLKDGLRTVEPSKRLARSYLEEAKASLERAEKNFKDKDLLWATVVIYYAEYYALYSFLQEIGIKCENHFCSIIAAASLLGEERIDVINRHKYKRIDAQYYMKTDKEEQIGKMLQEAKTFVAMFDEIVSNMTDDEVALHRAQLKRLTQQE